MAIKKAITIFYRLIQLCIYCGYNLHCIVLRDARKKDFNLLRCQKYRWVDMFVICYYSTITVTRENHACCQLSREWNINFFCWPTRLNRARPRPTCPPIALQTWESSTICGKTYLGSSTSLGRFGQSLGLFLYLFIIGLKTCTGTLR